MSLLVVSRIAPRTKIPMPINVLDRLLWILLIITHASLPLCRRGSLVPSVENTQV